MKQLPSEDKNILLFDAHYAAFTPAEMFDYWTKVEHLQKWDADIVEVDARVGGKYKKTFTQLGWVVAGEFTAFSPPTHLAFTWNWDLEPGLPETLVDVTFTARESGGTQLILKQGPFDDSEMALNIRQRITEGWVHFGMRLAGLRDGDVDIEPSLG